MLKKPDAEEREAKPGERRPTAVLRSWREPAANGARRAPANPNVVLPARPLTRLPLGFGRLAAARTARRAFAGTTPLPDKLG